MKILLPWILLVVVLLAWGWQTFAHSISPLQAQIVTTDNRYELLSQVRNDTSISDQDKAGYAAALAPANGVQPYGKTVGEVIREGREAIEVDAKATAEASAAAATVAHELSNDIRISPVSLQVKRGRDVFGGQTFDDPSKDVDVLDFEAVNQGTKTIKSFTATATVTNKGGDEIFDGRLTSADELLPGHSQTIHVEHIPELFEGEHARATASANLLLRYNVTQITYLDGTEASQ